MTKSILVALGITLASAGVAQTFLATDNIELQYDGTWKDNSTYFNIGNDGGYATMGLVDFDAASLAGEKITSATLVLTHSDYSLSVQTEMEVWAVSDNTAFLGLGNTSIVYGFGAGYTDGLGNQLGTATELATFDYVPNLVNPNTQDTISLSNLSALTSLVATPSSDIRIVIGSDQTGLADYLGVYGTTPPSLTVTASAVPEPAPVAVLSLTLLGVILRRPRH